VKILVISNLYPPDFLGGYELGCRQVVESLRAAGHEVTVLTANPRKPVPPQPGVLRRLKMTDVYDPYVMSNCRQVTAAGRYVEAHGIHAFNVHALLDALAETEPDVVYLWNLVGLGGLGLIAAVQHLGYPWVMHIMDAVPKVMCSLPFEVRPEVGKAFANLVRGRFLCCSQTVLDEILNGGVPIGARARVIPNWVNTPGTPDRTDYMPDGRLRIVTAGAISVAKGMDILIRAAGLLRERGYENFSVDIYGPCNDPSFQALIQQLDLDPLVRLCGVRTQAELAELYPSYDVFSFPTWEREPMAFAPMEAAAHGCAMVLSQVCGNSEWFIDRLDCLKADRTPEAFAKMLEQVLRGEIPLADVARRGMRTILRDFSLGVIIRRIERELADATARPRSAAGSADEAYRLAVIAEKTFQTIVQEAYAA
jgi:glycogen synthase